MTSPTGHDAASVPSPPFRNGGTKADQPANTGASEGEEHEKKAAAAEGLVDALGHLQTAALSMVAAARAAVDAAEQLVRDPRPLLDLIADAARAGWEPPAGSSAEPAPEHRGFEHIKVRPAAGAESGGDATADDAGSGDDEGSEGRSAGL